MRVLFWGTPEFATPPLRALLGEGFDVAGVVTQPDRPVGRSRSTLRPPPVKQVATEEGLQVLQPEKPRGDAFLAQLRALAPDISVVVAYGHILPQAVIDLPPRGTINIHASLLPVLRGAAPIQAAIREGHERTGVTIMRMVQRLDAGPSILQLATDINDDETYGELALRLSELGATALIEALALLELGKATEEPQDEALATYAPKIDRALTRVDWTQDARTVARSIRAFDPRPGAYTTLGSQELKCFGARLAPRPRSCQPGQLLSVSDDGLVVACGGSGPADASDHGGAVRVLQVQPAGKKRMAAAEWFRGVSRDVEMGQRFE
ncbi:MAG TPA: methionyl-tRNA formyltransferase [Gemmatimonadaceae bacterium]|nr:methionyl-tRNA formyltransferase [Gemmatimonadaceae bacterium]